MLAIRHWWSVVMLLPFLASSVGVRAEQVDLDVDPSYGVLKAEKKNMTWVRVKLTGFEMESESARPPVNVALVLDKSGSMQGDKIARAREAAIDAINRLRPEDIVSVITYDSTVNVLVPATKLADKKAIRKMISRIEADGSTALFAGVSKGAAEVRKFHSDDRVNRIILLSDGKANVGPSSPGELGDLGASLKEENISVSTLGLGLGYNEDLMVKLAAKSGGNHEFVEEATELADIFNREFDDVTSVVAQDVEVRIEVPEGIRPVRVLGNDAEITGQEVHIQLSQIYSRQEKYVVLELEVPPEEDGDRQKLVEVVVTYRNMQSHGQDRLTGKASIAFSDSEAKVEASMNKDVMEDVIALVANEQNKLATHYLDQGDLLRCREALISNAAFLKENASKLGSERLKTYYDLNILQAQQIEGRDTNRARKGMRAYQIQLDTQQRSGDR